MALFRFLFVLALCIPLAYIALRLFIYLIDNIGSGKRKTKRTSNRYASNGYMSGDYVSSEYVSGEHVSSEYAYNRKEHR